MFVDARCLPGGAVIQTDVCIVGSGPIGITLARELGAAGLKVALLESGGLKAHEAATELGQPAPDLLAPNIIPRWTTRRFGGNSTAWSVRTDLTANGVRLIPLAHGDFEQRSWIPESGWPLGHAELRAYYVRAQITFGLPPFGFEPTMWEDPWARQLPSLGDDVRTAVFQFGNRDRFTNDFGGEFAHSTDVTVYYHGTALELETNEAASQVTSVRAASFPGRELRVHAKYIVLAAGGLATPQLLLASDQKQPCGLGNGYGLVGRYYMDHPLLFGGSFVPRSRRLFEATDLYDLRTVRGTPVMGHLQLTDVALRREGLVNASMMLFPRVHLTQRQHAGVEALRHAWHRLRSGRLPGLSDLFQSALGVDGIAKKVRDKLLPRHPHSHLGQGGWSKLGNKAQRYGHYEVLHQAEQTPHPDNRISLSDERDRFGSRRIKIDWHWQNDDVAAFMRTQDVFAQALRRAELGEFRIERCDGRPAVLSASTAHYMGTTRMHEDPHHGVVDAQCRVHGIGNLFVAGSGVFPTGGFANPTLTTMALALRLADRIRMLHGHSGGRTKPVQTA